MTKVAFAIKTLAALVLTLMVATLAQAQATRTWVSGVGDDVNPCSRTAPCKTFAGAISKTAAGGEIDVLDSAGYGTITITKSITIDGAGFLGSILSAGTNGVVVNAAATDTVTLRNISINGANTGVNGIRYLAGAKLIVDACHISGVTNHGIDVNLATAGQLVVKETSIERCGGSGISLITSVASPSSIDMVGEGVRIHSCATGVNAQNGSRATLRNCIITHNTTGVAGSAGANPSVVNADTNVFSFNGTAISAGTGTTIRISNNFVTSNNTGLSAAGGAIISFSNNKITGNTTNGAPTGTSGQS